MLFINSLQLDDKIMMRELNIRNSFLKCKGHFLRKKGIMSLAITQLPWFCPYAHNIWLT